MKNHILLFGLTIFLLGCGAEKKNGNVSPEAQPQTPVSAVHPVYGHIQQSIALPATTTYLKKHTVTAPIPSFITETHIQPGTRIKAGEALYKLESKEQHALGKEYVHDNILVKSPVNGIVLDVLQQTGSYVSEGTALCTIADTRSMAFEINIPYEQYASLRNKKSCQLELPDGNILTASIQFPLATMNLESQAERIIAFAQSPFLPEGMIVKAVFTISNNSQMRNLIIPRSAICSNESMSEFWVMKIAGNNTAVKVPIKVITHNTVCAEILSSELSPKDNIIQKGNYGLENGDKVVLTK